MVTNFFQKLAREKQLTPAHPHLSELIPINVLEQHSMFSYSWDAYQCSGHIRSKQRASIVSHLVIIIQSHSLLGCLVGLVGRAWDSFSRGCGFKLYNGYRDYLKNKQKAMAFSAYVRQCHMYIHNQMLIFNAWVLYLRIKRAKNCVWNEKKRKIFQCTIDLNCSIKPYIYI